MLAATTEERADFFRQLRAIARLRGYKDGWTAHKFKDTRFCTLFWLAKRLFQYYCVASVRTDDRGALPTLKTPRSRERKFRSRALWPYPQHRGAPPA
jgi:hypothetical protein